MSDDLGTRRAEILRKGMAGFQDMRLHAANLVEERGEPERAARVRSPSEVLAAGAKGITVEAGRLTGFLKPEDNEKADELSRELVQVSRAAHFANTIGATTDAIIRCTAVFADKRSSDTAKAAAVIRCVAAAGQIAALFGPWGLMVSSVVGMISAIMESTTGQSESMLDQLEALMRKLAGEQTANEINAANRLLQRQIAALNAYPDSTLTWREVHEEAPLTSGISQFKILAASEWLYREENQANPIWAEVFDCHMQAVLTVVRLLKMCQAKLANPNDRVFLAVQKSIYSDFRAQCIKFDHKISKLGNFWCTGIGDHNVFSNKDLNKSWNSATDWGRFTSLAVSQDEDQKKVTGWGAYDDLGLGSGSFDNDMKILPQRMGCVDISIAPFLIGKENWCRLLMTSRGSSGKEPGRCSFTTLKAQQPRSLTSMPVNLIGTRRTSLMTTIMIYRQREGSRLP